MSNDGFCTSCRALLRNEIEETNPFTNQRCYVHHADAESFRRALKLPCPLCVRIWTAMGRPTVHAGTRFHPPFMKSDGTFRMNVWDAEEGPGGLIANGTGLQVQLSLIPLSGESSCRHLSFALIVDI